MKTISLIIILIHFLIATSCKLDMYKGCKNMPEQTSGTGLIIQNAVIVDFSSITNEELIITSESQNNLNLEVSFDNGKTYNPIDFSKYTLLGKYAEADCSAEFNRDVAKYIEQQKYVYKIKVVHCGLCKKLKISMNWVLIPKIEDDFSVEFVVEYEHLK